MLVLSLVCSQNKHLTIKQTNWFIGLNKQPNQTCAFVGATLLFPSCSVTREGRRSLWRSLYVPPLTLSVRLANILSVRRTGSVAKW